MSIESNLSKENSDTRICSNLISASPQKQAKPPHFLKLTHALHYLKDNLSLTVEPLQRDTFKLKETAHLEESTQDELLQERRLRSLFLKLGQVPSTNSPLSSSEFSILLKEEISKWIEEGYSSLSQLNTLSIGFPIEQITSITHPAIIEQIIILYQILNNPISPFDHAQMEWIMLQALTMAKPPHESALSELDFEQISSEIGKLIFAADKTPNLLKERITKKKESKLTLWLNKNLENAIIQIKKSVDKHYELHAKTDIQASDLAARERLIKEISYLLVTSHPSINSGLIPTILNAFCKTSTPLVNHNIELNTNLKLLQKNPRIRSSLLTIASPSSPRAPSNTLIESVTTNINPISQREVILTALTAILSHLRQGPAGSCFATFLAINMLASRPEESIKDFAAILQDNALTRTVDGIKIQFPFVLSALGHSSLQTFKLSANGQIINNRSTETYIWEAPGIIAAANMMKVPNPKKAVLEVLKKLQKEHLNKTEFELSPATLIESLSTGPENYQKGIIAFEAQVSNPLLHAWENAIAGMAEANESGIIKSAIINATLNAILNRIQNFSSFPKTFLDTFSSILHDLFNQSSRFQYDPAFIQKDAAIDQHSCAGGFALYDRNNSDKLREWTRINSPQNYQQFILKLCKQTKEKIFQQKDVVASEGLYERLFKDLEEFITSDAFLYETIKNQHPSNAALNPNLLSLEKLKYTPWLVLTGNNPKKILKVYLENEAPPPYRKICSHHRSTTAGKNHRFRKKQLSNPS